MEMVFKLRMINDEDDNFVRDYEVLYSMTLLDFHYTICDDLQYDPGNMVSFFAADRQWRKLQEFTLVDVGEGTNPEQPPIPMGEVTLGQILRNNNDRLIYQFDLFEDRAMFLELMATTRSQEGMVYPRVAFANGAPPDQFDPEASPRNQSIFEEAMDDFSDFGGDDQYDDE